MFLTARRTSGKNDEKMYSLTHTLAEGMSTRIEVFSDSWKGFTKFILLKEKPPKEYMHVVRGRLTKNKRPLDQTMCGLKYGQKVVKPLRKERERERSKNGRTRSRNSIMLDDWEASKRLFNWSRRRRIQRNYEEREEKFGSAHGRGNELKVPPAFRKLKRSTTHPTRFQKQSMLVWKLMNPRGNVWNHLHQKIMKTTWQAKDTTQWLIKIWCTNLFLCRWRQFLDESNSGQGMEEARSESSMEAGQSEEQKGGHSGSTERQK